MEAGANIRHVDVDMRYDATCGIYIFLVRWTCGSAVEEVANVGSRIVPVFRCTCTACRAPLWRQVDLSTPTGEEYCRRNVFTGRLLDKYMEQASARNLERGWYSVVAPKMPVSLPFAARARSLRVEKPPPPPRAS